MRPWRHFLAASAALLCVGCLNETQDESVSFRFDFGSTLAGTRSSPPGSSNGSLYAMTGGRAGFQIPFHPTLNQEGDSAQRPALMLCRLANEGEDHCPDFVTLHSDSTASLQVNGERVVSPWGRSCVLRNIRLQAEIRVDESPVILNLDAEAHYVTWQQTGLVNDSTIEPPVYTVTVLRVIVDSAEAVVDGKHVILNESRFTGSADVVCRSAP